MAKDGQRSLSLDELDDLSRDEYGTTFAGSLEGQPEAMFVRRLARLSGIPLKRPFSEPQEADRESVTGARRYWRLAREIECEVTQSNSVSYPMLEGMRERHDPAFELVEEMTRERFHASAATLQQVADTIVNAQAESNWFTNLILVMRRKLCKPGKKDELVIEGIKKAADEIANKSVEYALTAVIEPLAIVIVKAFPLLAFVPHIAVLGATFFIVKYAGHSFCNIEITPEFQLLLAGNYSYESK